MEEQKRYLLYVQPFIRLELVQSIRLSTRPDYITEDILKMLKKYNVSTIELGAQSFDDDVLKKSRRGHTSKQIEKAASLIHDYGFKLGLQMMIGLPGDTLEKAISTAKKIVKADADCTRIYPSVVIKDTLMHEWYNQGKYKPLDLDKAVNWTKQIFPIFENAGTNIIRVGLHPSEGLLNGEELIDGPFHPSFKELVLSRIWGDLLESKTKNIIKSDIEIKVHPKEINYAIGYKSENRIRLTNKFTSVKFTPDISFDGRNFSIH